MEQIRSLVDIFKQDNLVLSGPANTIVIILYSILVTVAVTGNLLVMCAVLRRKEMRTARNIFIFNLALSDFLLATSIPFTLFDALTRAWPLPYSWLSCSLIKTFPCIAAFMSSLTIVCVALDRFRCIVQSGKVQVTPFYAWLLLPLICIISIMLASPIFITSRLYNLKHILKASYELPEDLEFNLKHILVCIEDWSSVTGSLTKEDRIWYTVFSGVFQYILPLIIISFLYGRIFHFIKTKRMSNTQHSKKQRRTNIILFSISLIFFLSWLPFSVYCIITEAIDVFDSTEKMMVTFLVCHMIGISSACTNPVLYGFLNDNFVKEFNLLCPMVRRLCSCSDSSCSNATSVEQTPIFKHNIFLKKINSKEVQTEVEGDNVKKNIEVHVNKTEGKSHLCVTPV